MTVSGREGMARGNWPKKYDVFGVNVSATTHEELNERINPPVTQEDAHFYWPNDGHMNDAGQRLLFQTLMAVLGPSP